MPVEFFVHTEPSDPNERRAIFSLARELLRRFGSHSAPHYTLVVGVNPDNDATLKNRGLTEVDAMLFGAQMAALLEFKNYPDPIEGRDCNGKWTVYDPRRQQRIVVEGGRAGNPYRQALRAHACWAEFFTQAGVGVPTNNWHHLNGYILFYPYLNRRSQICNPTANHQWLAICSADEVFDKLFTHRPQIYLSVDEIGVLARDVLAAKAWPALVRAIDDTIGYLYLTDADGNRTQYTLNPFDLLTVGRGRQNRIHVDERLLRVSGEHLTIRTQTDSVRVYDIQSKNDTFVNGVSLRAQGGMVLLADGDVLTLGGKDGPRIATLLFRRLRSASERDEPDDTTLPTELA